MYIIITNTLLIIYFTWFSLLQLSLAPVLFSLQALVIKSDVLLGSDFSVWPSFIHSVYAQMGLSCGFHNFLPVLGMCVKKHNSVVLTASSGRIGKQQIKAFE